MSSVHILEDRRAVQENAPLTPDEQVKLEAALHRKLQTAQQVKLGMLCFRVDTVSSLKAVLANLADSSVLRTNGFNRGSRELISESETSV